MPASHQMTHSATKAAPIGLLRKAHWRYVLAACASMCRCAQCLVTLTGLRLTS